MANAQVNQIDVNDTPYDIKSKDPWAEGISVEDTEKLVVGSSSTEIKTDEQSLFDALAKQTKQYINFASGTLTAGQTSVSIDCNGKSLTSSSMLDIYTDKYGLVPKTITVNPDQHNIVMTFKEQTVDVHILVRIMEEKGGV